LSCQFEACLVDVCRAVWGM